MHNQLRLQVNRQIPNVGSSIGHLVSSQVNYLKKGKSKGGRGETILDWDTVDN